MIATRENCLNLLKNWMDCMRAENRGDGCDPDVEIHLVCRVKNGDCYVHVVGPDDVHPSHAHPADALIAFLNDDDAADLPSEELP